MKRVLNDQGRIASDAWTLLSEDQCGSYKNIESLPNYSIIPLSYCAEVLPTGAGFSDQKIGLGLSVDDDLEVVQHYLKLATIIVLSFPVFSDGRIFSLATTLRQRYRYWGEIRVVGSYMIDQIPLLFQCGCSTIELSDEADLDSILKIMSHFKYSYQQKLVPQLSGSQHRQVRDIRFQ